jgi:phytoene dehydrogenase-like protein
VGSKQKFEDLLMERAEDGPLAVQEWRNLQKRLKTLGGSTLAVSLLNLRQVALPFDTGPPHSSCRGGICVYNYRGFRKEPTPNVASCFLLCQDAGFLATTAGAAPYALSHPDVFTDLPLTFDSLHKTVDKIVTVPFLRNFIDTMCIFCGFPAKGAMTAHMLYILERFFEEGAAYSVPLGGTIEIANALVRGLEKNGGKLTTNAHVEHIIVEDGRAVGVVLKNGDTIKARQGVVSNATPFDTIKMLNLGKQELPPAVKEWKDSLGKLPRHGAILHLFLAIDAKDLDLSHIQDPAHLIVQDWGRSLQDSQNLCSFFTPSLLDPSVCPPGKHVLHVYSSGGEPYEAWENLVPGSPEYEALKEKRSEVLWEAVERCIPDVRARCEFSIVGSPLAHEAFLRRDRGTYGMAWAAGTSAPYAGLLKNILPFPFPNLKTPVDGLLRCGDSCFPGIGTPSAAASGVICANTMTPVADHIQVLKETAALHPMYKFMDPGMMANLYLPFVAGRTPSQELKVELLGSPLASVKTVGTPPTWT